MTLDHKGGRVTSHREIEGGRGEVTLDHLYFSLRREDEEEEEEEDEDE